MSEPELTLDDPERLEEELVAYLDGELDPVARRRLEDRLASDPVVRNELNRLERTWQLLERLPRAEVTEAFTRTTVEMVAVKAAEELEQHRAREPRRKLARWGAIAAVIALTTAFGFAFSRVAWPDPNRQLVRDLPILENLDQYRQIEDIEYLKRLHAAGLFKGDEVVSTDEK